jgi:hypothetical protein
MQALFSFWPEGLAGDALGRKAFIHTVPLSSWVLITTLVSTSFASC